ncbi:MAG: hypothetical protein ACRDU5_17895 [Mycobacterium sp.]
MSDPAPPDPSDDPSSDRQRIIRRNPSGPIPAAEGEPQTSIIRRHPTGPIPEADESRTGLIRSEAESQTSYIPRARPVAIAPSGDRAASPKTAVATAVVTTLSGWTTALIATDLITGWWASDRLFCVAVGFLTGVFAAATVGGLIALLLRRRIGRWLIVVGSVIGLMIFASLFVAGATLQPVVYAIPALPVASILLAMLPATKRWGNQG